MKTLRALVVDDEAPARRRLIRMLEELGGVEVVAQAEDGEQALEQINASQPDVVFLDVRMPRMDGLSLAQRYAKLPPLVFVTAYDAFAVQAFEVDAVDYLLKPVRSERLASALEKVRARTRAGAEPAAIALEKVQPQAAAGTRVVASTRGLIRLFEATELTRLWSSDKYTVFSSGGEEHLTEEPLTALEARLAPHGFLRTHRSELVNLQAVRSVRFADGMYQVELSDGQHARVSRRSIIDVKRALGLAVD